MNGLGSNIVIISLPMTSDGPPIPSPVHKGDMVWIFDIDTGIKVPMTVMKVHEDGSWDGRQTWVWGMA